MAFATTDVDMLFNGVPTSCVSIALTDPSMDSSAMNLLNTYKPFALPLIAEWAKQNKAVALDFRTIGGTEERAEYTIERPGSFSIPVIFLWDKLSARRAAFFMQQLNDAPAGFVCKKVNNQQL
ncbi:MAG: hypothetical protein JST29_05255 [Bacteroidetes bacterium]|nr:hypothetical protein [Bacteroidota bacterium]